MINRTLLNRLRSVDTPTVCNAIEVAQGKRGFNDFSRGTLVASDPLALATVGYARTAKITAVCPSSEPVQELRQRRMDYYRYMSESPTPSIAVIEDLDFPHCIGAYWGEINSNVHQAFGLGGALTNGVMRDLGDLPDGFPVLAGSIGPSHGFVHVKDYNCDVTIFGMNVSAGDLIHADRHGAVVIPNDIIPNIDSAITKLLMTEQIVLSATKKSGFCFDDFETAWNEFEKART